MAQNLLNTVSSVVVSGFNRFTSQLDAGITSFLRDTGNTQVGAKCPKCRSDVAAPVGARVRCGGCGTEFSMGSAGQEIKAMAGFKPQEREAQFQTLPGTISRSHLAS